MPTLVAIYIFCVFLYNSKLHTNLGNFHYLCSPSPLLTNPHCCLFTPKLDHDQIHCSTDCGWHCQLVHLHPCGCGHCCLPLCEVVLPEGRKGNEAAGGSWSV